MTEIDQKSGSSDRIGVGWRPELGMGILERIDELDVIEIVAENYTDLSSRQLTTFARLTGHVAVTVHALSLGLASAYAVSQKHLDAVARVIGIVQPESWSEYLAFVRSEGRELGHLAAPPWSEETVDSTILNVETAGKVVGAMPHLENIASLYYPIGSTLEEPEWTTRIVKGTRTKLLIDLENIYANSRNFKKDWVTELLQFPLEDVQYVHIAGGHEANDTHGEYFIDDHKHQVSQEVYQLLETLAAHTNQSLTVVLERDGNFPPFDELVEELQQARSAINRGRGRLTAHESKRS